MDTVNGFVLAADVSATETDDGMVLLDQRIGRFWHLNASGARTLRLLLDGCSEDDTAERLTSACPEQAPRAREDVRALVAALRRANLVVAP